MVSGAGSRAGSFLRGQPPSIDHRGVVARTHSGLPAAHFRGAFAEELLYRLDAGVGLTRILLTRTYGAQTADATGFGDLAILGFGGLVVFIRQRTRIFTGI